jgi:LysM repeat protein
MQFNNKTSIIASHPQVLKIEIAGSKQVGRYAWTTTYQITCQHRLNSVQLNRLRSAGVLGIGQQFVIMSPCDGSEAGTLIDVPFVEINDESHQIVNSNPVNRYSNKPYGSTKVTIYTYICQDLTDSGD